MTDITTPFLAGASAGWNKFLSDLDGLKNMLASGLQIDPSTLSSTLSGGFTSIFGSLRNITPAIPALPNINLQSQLTSLSGLVTGSDRHTTLLNDITSNFGSELSAGGFSLDTLVTNASTAIDAGNTLSGVVPNFAFAADGLSGAIEKANAVLQATGDSVTEEASTITANSALAERIELLNI